MAAVIAAAAVTGGCTVARVNETETEAGDQSSNIFTMGTVFSVRVISDNAQDLLAKVQSTLYAQDSMLSWRTEGSLDSQFNEKHQADMSSVSDLIELTLDVCKKSNGALDPTVLPLTKLWQFDKMEDTDFDVSKMKVPAAADIQTALKDVDYKKLEFDQDTGILRTDDTAIQLELGAVGKGYAIDQALDVIKDGGAGGALISAGSSIGAMGHKEDGSNYTISIRDPRGEESDYIGLLHTTDCTISTSGDYERYFTQDGKRYHHILDPHTGYPADSGLMQVTVICGSGALGDALSTACFVLGLDKGMQLAKEYNVLAIFVDTDKNIWYNSKDVLSILDFTGKDSGYTLREYTYN